MKTSRLLRIVLLTGLSGGTLLSTSCGDIVVTSVKEGLFNFISGSVSVSLSGGQISDFLNTLGRGGNTTTGI